MDNFKILPHRLTRNRSKSEPRLPSVESIKLSLETTDIVRGDEPKEREMKLNREANLTETSPKSEKPWDKGKEVKIITHKKRFSLNLGLLKFSTFKSKDSFESTLSDNEFKRDRATSKSSTNSKSSFDNRSHHRSRSCSKASNHSTDSKSSEISQGKNSISIEACKTSENDVQTVQLIRRGSLKELGDAVSSSFIGTSEDKKLRRASRQIDKELEQDFLKMIGSKVIKVAILGSGNSGKSTFIRQMKILNRIQFTDDERYNSIVSIHGNIVTAICLLIKACSDEKDLKFRFDIEDDPEVSLFLKNFVIGKDFIPETLKESLTMIWNNSTIQECFKYESVRSRMQDTAI